MDNLTGRNVGKTCRTHYRGTFNDGTQSTHPMTAANRWSLYAVQVR